MEKKYREALTKLIGKLSFEVENISAADLFYTDGSAQGSFFKLVFHGEKTVRAVVYIYEGRWWVSFGTLSDAESLTIHDWIDGLTCQH